MTTLEYLGICNDDIEHAAGIMEAELKRIGFDINEIDDVYEDMKSRIVDWFDWERGSNSIIDCLFYCAESAVNSKVENVENVDYYVNGWDSHFNVRKN